MIHAQDRILHDLDSTSAQLASLLADLKSCRVVLRECLRKPPLLLLEEYDRHFTNAFTHIEKAKMAIRAIYPICHQADFLKKKTEQKGRRR